MANLIWSLVLVALVLMGAVLVPILVDRPCEHLGATEAYADELRSWRRS